MYSQSLLAYSITNPINTSPHTKPSSSIKSNLSSTPIVLPPLTSLYAHPDRPVLHPPTNNFITRNVPKLSQSSSSLNLNPFTSCNNYTSSYTSSLVAGPQSVSSSSSSSSLSESHAGTPENTGTTQHTGVSQGTGLSPHANHHHHHHTSSSSSIQLTEKNLVNNNYYNGIPSPPKSSVSSSIGSISPVSSPSLMRMKDSSINLVEANPAHKDTPAQTTSSTLGNSNHDTTLVAKKKRRQRSGPSCDSCRQRKVKCDAEIRVISTDSTQFHDLCEMEFHLSQEEISNLITNGKPYSLGNMNQLIVQNQKLVKFKSCKSCENKQLSCCFSKGFTKEDIIFLAKRHDSSSSSNSSNNSSSTVSTPSILSKGGDSGKVSKPSTNTTHQVKIVPAIAELLECAALIQNNEKTRKSSKPVKDSSDSSNRKSSCNLCRQRKVKCIFNEELGMCEGCHRKNKVCSFDS
ncbi:hypothetical protein CAAN1_26S00298 [[Candida] anglica]|uniref:Zn(2)-C6 fungal-type domain-containing protein n=1 Tax=[Candida] anglica TaxID=148631 RepID=A0ABP0EHW2_9ASCO